MTVFLTLFPAAGSNLDGLVYFAPAAAAASPPSLDLDTRAFPPTWPHNTTHRTLTRTLTTRNHR